MSGSILTQGLGSFGSAGLVLTLGLGSAEAVEETIELLGGGASPYKQYKSRDHAAEVLKDIQDKQDALDKAAKDLADKRALDAAKNITARQAKRLEKQLMQMEREMLLLQNELQALVAMKERIDRDNEDTMLVLAMCSPFGQLKL